jgi:tetratricopeptide (TPR) repeat protein
MPDELDNNDATQPVHVNVENTQPAASPNGMDGTTQPMAVDDIPTQKPPASSEATQPLVAQTDAGKPVDGPKEKPVRLWRGRLIFIALAIILVGIGAGSYLGYQSGIQDRTDRAASQKVMEAATHFQNGLDAMNENQYSIAKAQFEYVITVDPNFPGVADKLAEVMIALIPTTIPTATLTPTPEFTPTPDMRGEEQIFTQIQSLLAAKNWDSAITSIESLRTKNLTYKTIQVDGFYYVALRNRGVDKILRLGDLEGGMYDLALAARFGPLDGQADGYRLYARYYEIGASFWEVDWEKAYNYFMQVAPYLPNLRDASNVFAIDRYRQAATHFAQKLMDAGDACKAKKILDDVLKNNYRNATTEPLATKVAEACNPPTQTPKPVTPTLTATLSLTPIGPTPGGSTITPSPITGATVVKTVVVTTAVPPVVTTAAPTKTPVPTSASTNTPAQTTAVPPTNTPVPTATK